MATITKNSPNVAFKRKELKYLLKQYTLIEDCLEGEEKVKSRGVSYLPQPNAEDESEENLSRYSAYKTRAVFYNVTKRTLNGLVGQIFARDAAIDVPELLKPVVDNANGGGVSIIQLAKRACADVLAYGRSGLFVDYPVTDAPATKAELESGEIRPTINVYKPSDIINWRKKARGAKEILSLVVLHETYVYSDDGFEMKEADQWRVLRINEETDVYTVEVWRKNAALFEIAEGPYIPSDSSGKALNEIPFTFIGSDDNDDLPNKPPLYDLASLNIAHYRNSADYEESCFIVGQPTPYFAGLTEEWVKDVLKGTVSLGSRGAVPLPEGGSAGLLQVTANSMPFEAMEHKERQMVALGAKLVEQSSVQRTATEANLENASETSTLSSSAKNVSNAFLFALNWCAAFAGATGNIKFELHTDFDLAHMTSQERQQLISEWQAGAIAFEEMRYSLRRSGIARLDDVAAKNLISQELATNAALMADSVGNENSQ